MKQIRLTKGRYAIVDDEDYARLSQHKWHLQINRTKEYAVRRTGLPPHQKAVFMHRDILLPTEDFYVDHVNGDGLDNRRSNLRLATNSQNVAAGKMRSNNSSGYRGVYWHGRVKRYRAVICCGGKKKQLGTFTSAEEAARTYDIYAKLYFGEFASLNFPEELDG